MGKTLAYKILENHLVEGNLVAGEEITIKIDQTLTQRYICDQSLYGANRLAGDVSPPRSLQRSSDPRSRGRGGR